MIELLIGPARSGKSSRALKHFCEETQKRGAGRVLWVVPHKSLARLLRRRVVEHLGEISDLKILTLDDLSRWIFQLKPQGKRILSEFTRSLYLAHLLDQTQDSFFSKAKKRPELVESIARDIDELKEHLLWPAKASHPFSQEYEDLLKKDQVVDRKSMFAESVRILRKDKEFLRRIGVESVLLYGFTHFSPLQWKEVEVLLEQVPAWISITADLNQSHLFQESIETIQDLEKQFKIDKKEILTSIGKGVQVQLFELSQYESECEWMAREIVQLCECDGIAPNEIAILSGAGADSIWLVRQIFNRYQIKIENFSNEPIHSQSFFREFFRDLDEKKKNGEEEIFSSADSLYQYSLNFLQQKKWLENFMDKNPEGLRIQLQAFKKWKETLYEAATYPDFRSYVLKMLENLRFSHPPSKERAVHFYPTEIVPLESYRVIFVSHFSESSFPRSNRFNLFHSSSLLQEEKHQAREKFVFYQMVTRAKEKLYLFYSKRDWQGQEVLPSLLVQELLSIFPEMKKSNFERKLGIVPWMDKGKSEEEFDFMNRYKEQVKEGKLKSKEILEKVKNRLVRSSSVTQFENFVKCPFLHFGQNLMQLEEAKADQWNRILGQMSHSVLANIGIDLDQDKESILIQKIEEEVDQLFKDLSFPLTHSQLEIEKKQMKSKLAAFIRKERLRIKESSYRPAYFEKPFGQDGVEPYRLSLSNELELIFRGRIDRIDLSEDKKEAIVIDYKSGEVPLPKEIREGRSLQIACYLDACRKLFQLEPVEGIYLSIKASRATRLKAKDIQDRIAEMKTQLSKQALEILKGEIAPKFDAARCQSCSYRSVCRVSEVMQVE